MIDNADAVRLLDDKRDGAVIVATMNANHSQFGLVGVSKNPHLDFPMSNCMGKSSSFALGVALSHPERKVMVLDGDGSLLMNLGTMVTISEQAPDNLIHFVFDNGIYAITGGQPVPGAERVNWKNAAAAAGYASSFSFDNLEDLTVAIDEVLASEGPVFVHLAITPEPENRHPHYRPKPRRTMFDGVRELPKTLNQA